MNKKSFEEIYGQWEKCHDESLAISKRVKASGSFPGKGKADTSINIIRRMNAQDEIDLHEIKLEDAIRATENFLDISYAIGLRKVRIITGKGLHSVNGEAVLKPVITNICQNHSRVREVFTGKASEGGSGALIIILKARRR